MLKMVMAGAAALALVGGAASAAPVTFYSYGSGAPALPLVTDFSSDTAGSAPSYAPTGYSWSGDAVVLDSSSGAGAAPAFSASTSDPGNFLSVEAGQTETLNFAAGIKDVAIYVGSLDSYNNLNFTFTGPNVNYSGTDLGAVSGADNGNQTAANTNGVFLFSFASPINSVTLSSSQNSFEIASISAAVPEPMTWAMMIVGLTAVGGVLRSRKKVAVKAAVA